MSRGRQVLALLLLFGLFLIAVSNNDSTSSNANSSSNLLDNSAFLSESPQYPEAVRQLIVSHRYECPRIGMLWPKGESPLGTKLQVLCGPVGSTDLYRALHYIVYPERLSVVVCKPFDNLGRGCE